jgi:hypothetical protein
MVGGILLVLGIGGIVFMAQNSVRHRPPGQVDQVEAVANARQLGLALFEFETEYGRFPDWSTEAEVRKRNPTDLEVGARSSNDFLRQLFAAGIVSEEKMFYAHIEGARRGDGVITKGDALKKGECGFTYLPGANMLENPVRPILVAPMIPGTDRFDPGPFNGKAVVLRVDNSVKSYKIDKRGHAIVEGRNLMDPHHPVWRGRAPAVAWPDL